jgi:hypothetical protein
LIPYPVENKMIDNDDKHNLANVTEQGTSAASPHSAAGMRLRLPLHLLKAQNNNFRDSFLE